MLAQFWYHEYSNNFRSPGAPCERKHWETTKQRRFCTRNSKRARVKREGNLWLTNLFTVLAGHRPLLLHDRFLLKFSMVRDVRDDLAVLLDSQCLRIIRHLGELALCLLELRVVLDVTLNLRVLRDAFQFRCLRHCGGLCLRYVSANDTVTQLITAAIKSKQNFTLKFCQFLR